MNILANTVADSTTFMFSIALKGIPILLETIFKIGKEIRETVKRTKANRHQCLRLSERIDILTGFLRERKFDDALSESMKTALHNFITFLQKSLHFIEIFTNASFFKRLFHNKDYLLQFTEFHNELTQHVVDLTLGIGLMSILVNKKQDEHDRLLDLTDSQQYAQSTDHNHHVRCYPLLPPFEESLMNEELNGNHQQMIDLQWDNGQHIFFAQSHQQKDGKDEVCSSIEQQYALTIPRPFSVHYNPYTQTIEVINGKEQIVNMVRTLRNDMDVVLDALRKTELTTN
ncbi:unnamed protein product [Rotaria sp. Silwood2]|nr:unnamed protein product [Rotaria sp. Silwood2]